MTEASAASDTQSLRRQLWLVGGRLAVTTLLLGAVLLSLRFRDISDVRHDAMIILVALTYATTLAVAPVLPRMRRPALWAGLQVGWDFALVTSLVYLFDGSVSGFSFLYGVVILAAALTIGPRAAQLFTALSSAAYLLVGLGLANNWLPPPAYESIIEPSADEIALAVLRNLVAFLLVGLLATALAERLERAGGQLREAAASAAEATLLTEDIVKSLASGLLIVDRKGMIQQVNPAGALLLGSTPESLEGRPVEPLLPFEHTKLERGEGTGVRFNGEPFPVGFSRSPLRASREEDRILGTLVLFQDLTEMRELREQAYRSQRLAALGRLAAGLAHEIRNPLGSISGSVEMVREAPQLSTEDRQLLSLVLDEVDRLNDLVTTMLDVGSPRSPVKVRVDLGDLATSIRNVVESRSEVTLRLQRSDAPVTVHGDPSQLRQVLWNLVKNAMQFTGMDGEVRLRVWVDADSQACLSVSDDGPGLHEEDVERVFDMFYSKRHHGVGLGLALVRQIVVAHEGTVDVESAANQGATFTVRLPLFSATEAEASVESGFLA